MAHVNFSFSLKFISLSSLLSIHVVSRTFIKYNRHFSTSVNCKMTLLDIVNESKTWFLSPATVVINAVCNKFRGRCYCPILYGTWFFCDCLSRDSHVQSIMPRCIGITCHLIVPHLLLSLERQNCLRKLV